MKAATCWFTGFCYGIMAGTAIRLAFEVRPSYGVLLFGMFGYLGGLTLIVLNRED